MITPIWFPEPAEDAYRPDPSAPPAKSSARHRLANNVTKSVARHFIKAAAALEHQTADLGYLPDAGQNPSGEQQVPCDPQYLPALPSSRRPHSASVSFWGALTPAEQHAFQSMAQKCKFAPGVRLIQEGSLAGHVIVIIKGRVRISTWKDGADQTIAERGAGQLIGESAALSISTRSATVIAVEEVHALVVTVEDFEAFITDHPVAYGIAAGQVRERLGEGQHRRLPLLSGQNCTIVRTDVTEFGGHTRSAEHRRLIRQANLRMTQTSLQGIEESYSWEDRGDGLLIVVRPDIPTLTVLESLLTGLPPELKRHNHMYADAARIQLRIAIDVGPVVSDSAGISSDSIILASRLVDAHELKTAIRSRDADLGVIASEFVYSAAIRDANAFVDPTRYVRVQVNVKETDTYAWMKIIDLASLTRCPVDQGPTGVLPDVSARPRAARLRHGHEHCYRRAHPHHATARPRRLRAD